MKHTMKKTPKTPNQPATFTHQDRARLRAAFAAGVHHAATGIAEDIQSSALHNWDKLTDSEVQLIAASGVLIPTDPKRAEVDYWAARTVILAVYPERLPIQWGAEGLRPNVRRVRQWVKNRG